MTSKPIRFTSRPAREIAGVSVIAMTPEETPATARSFPVRYADKAIEAAASGRWTDYVARFAARDLMPPLASYLIHDPICFWPTMVVATADGTIIRETATGRKLLRRIPDFGGMKRKQLHALAREGTPLTVAIDPPEPLAGDFFLVASTVYANYYHWLIECLPKVALWRQTGEQRRLLCPPLDQPFHRPSLALAGVATDQIVELHGHARIAGELIFADRIGPGTNRISRTIVPFFDAIRPKAAAGANARRLLISRRGAAVRRLLNEDALAEVLTPLGFVTIQAETLSFADQAALFAEAEIIVAPHGAGLANIAFCQPGTRVIELVHERFDQGGATSYAALADLFGINYGLVVGLAEDDADEDFRAESLNFRVEPAAIIAMIEDLAAA